MVFTWANFTCTVYTYVNAMVKPCCSLSLQLPLPFPFGLCTNVHDVDIPQHGLNLVLLQSSKHVHRLNDEQEKYYQMYSVSVLAASETTDLMAVETELFLLSSHWLSQRRTIKQYISWKYVCTYASTAENCFNQQQQQPFCDDAVCSVLYSTGSHIHT